MTSRSRPRVFVLVDKAGLIVAASVDDGTPESVGFLAPIPRDLRLFHVDGPVQMFAPVSDYLPLSTVPKGTQA